MILFLLLNAGDNVQYTSEYLRQLQESISNLPYIFGDTIVTAFEPLGQFMTFLNNIFDNTIEFFKSIFMLLPTFFSASGFMPSLIGISFCFVTSYYLIKLVLSLV